MSVSRAAVCAVVGMAATLLTGCGPGGVALDVAALGLPQGGAPAALATTTVTTSPDGGIYKNPDHMEVLLVRRHPVDALATRLGTAASWAQLRPLGDFTLVAVRLRNDGKVSSDPRLGDLQMASDYAPAGTATGPLRRFYHPTYPLALIADSSPSADCSIHIDPGHWGLAVLVYPPVDLPTTLVWGRLGDFVLSVPTGGALPPLQTDLRAVSCTPPVAPPT
jgi:hypothetical protein